MVDEERTKKDYGLSEGREKDSYRENIRILNIDQRILKSEWNINQLLPFGRQERLILHQNFPT
jgi:hypothetical protein